MVRAINSIDELNGCIIGFQGNNSSRVLDPGLTTSLNFGRCCIIIEEIETADAGLTADTQRFADLAEGLPDGHQQPNIVTNRSRMGLEFVGAGLSCGLTVVSAVGVLGGVAAEIPSGGTSTFLVVAGWVGLTTAGLQCLNGLVRVGMVVSNPDGNSLQQLDSNTLYSGTTVVVDALGLASGVASLPAAGRNLWAILARQRSFAARGLSETALRQMNRAERLRVIGEVVEEASRTPEGRDAIIAAARRVGVGSQSIQSTSGLSVRNAARMAGVISAETTRRLHATVLSAISVPAGGVVSALPSSVVGNASGSVNWVINIVSP